MRKDVTEAAGVKYRVINCQPVAGISTLEYTTTPSMSTRNEFGVTRGPLASMAFTCSQNEIL